MTSSEQLLKESSKQAAFNPGFLSAITVLIMVFIMGLVKIYSPDLGFHLKSADWMLENKRFIRYDTFSYGTSAHKYFDLQWLYQLLVYALHKNSEMVLVISNALLITVSLVLVSIRFCKNTGTDNRSIKLGLFAFMAVIFVQPLSFEIRPQVFSWIFLNLVLLSVEAYKRGSKNALFMLPVIMLLWANTHSIAILGLAVTGIYNAGIYFENKRLDKKLLIYSLLSFAAFFINPYFFKGFIYSLSQFGIISGNSLFKSYLGELQSPFTVKEIQILGIKYFINPLFIIHLSALLSVFTIYRAVKLKQFTDAMLLAAFLLLLYLANRNYGIFILVSLPFFAKYFIHWLELRKERQRKHIIHVSGKNKNKEHQPERNFVPDNEKLYKRYSLAAVIVAVMISITTFTDGYRIFIHSPYRFGFNTDNDLLPVQATKFLNKNQVKGKLLNHLDFGGYLMANYKEPVFIDGRMDLFEDDFFEKYYESLTVQNGLKKLLTEYNPDIVIFPYIKAVYWWNYFLTAKEKTGYKAVYFDGLSVIYLKTNSYPALPVLTEKDILKNLDPDVARRLPISAEISKPSGLMVLIKGLWQKQSFSIADQNKATYCFTNAFDTAAIHYSVSGIENSTVHTPNIYKNLALYFQDRKMYSEAEWYQQKSK